MDSPTYTTIGSAVKMMGSKEINVIFVHTAIMLGLKFQSLKIPHYLVFDHSPQFLSLLIHPMALAFVIKKNKYIMKQ